MKVEEREREAGEGDGEEGERWRIVGVLSPPCLPLPPPFLTPSVFFSPPVYIVILTFVYNYDLINKENTSIYMSSFISTLI